MNVIFSDTTDIPDIPANGIFLAGPTHRTDKYDKSWRKDAIAIFEKLGYNGIIYVPEYETDSPFIESTENIHRQTDWEWASLDKASVIMFWIPRKLPDMPGFTTNIEFGMFMSVAPEKVILGFPETAEKMRYLDYLYEQVGKRKSVHTLEETIAESLRLWNERNIK